MLAILSYEKTFCKLIFFIMDGDKTYMIIRNDSDCLESIQVHPCHKLDSLEANCNIPCSL